MTANSAIEIPLADTFLKSLTRIYSLSSINVVLVLFTRNNFKKEFEKRVVECHLVTD